MTPRPEQLAMAERIASTFAPYGTAKWVVAHKAALAAIIETTEAAAKLLEPYADSYAVMARISTDSRVDCRSVEADIKYNMIAALRADEHLKGQP